MKNSFKMIPVLAGIALAALGSVNKAEAANPSNAENASFYAGDCVGSGSCGFTSQGTTLIGKWHED